MTKKNLFTLVLCLFCFGTTTHAQRIPTLEEAVYGGLIKTEGGSNVNWMKDGERDRKSTRLNSSHRSLSRMPSSA